jgi:hypothetical protein
MVLPCKENATNNVYANLLFPNVNLPMHKHHVIYDGAEM